jgi:hypothetical protein
MRDWDTQMQAARKTKFPTANVMVAGWIMEDDPRRNLRLYKGVRLACVVTGWSYMKLIIHWHADGMAMGGPTSYNPIALTDI